MDWKVDLEPIGSKSSPQANKEAIIELRELIKKDGSLPPALEKRLEDIERIQSHLVAQQGELVTISANNATAISGLQKRLDAQQGDINVIRDDITKLQEKEIDYDNHFITNDILISSNTDNITASKKTISNLITRVSGIDLRVIRNNDDINYNTKQLMALKNELEAWYNDIMPDIKDYRSYGKPLNKYMDINEERGFGGRYCLDRLKQYYGVTFDDGSPLSGLLPTMRKMFDLPNFKLEKPFQGWLFPIATRQWDEEPESSVFLEWRRWKQSGSIAVELVYRI